MNTKEKQCKVMMPQTLWDVASHKLGRGNVSKFIRDQLQSYVDGDDNEETIIAEINEKEKEIIALRTKLQDIRETKIMLGEYKQDLTKPLNAINRMANKQGCIGKNQLAYFCNTWHCKMTTLVEYCQKNDVKIVNYQEVM